MLLKSNLTILNQFILIILISLNQDVVAQETPANNFEWPGNKKAALSLSFDDARLSNVDVGLDLFKKYGVQVTYYVNPGPMKERIDKWKQAVIDGHEIGNHTVVHPCTGNFDWSRSRALESYSIETMRQELVSANQQIKQLVGVVPRSFAYTCGNTFVGRGRQARSYVPLVAELFESGRGWLNEAPNDPYFADMAQIQGIEMDGKDFEHDIKPLLEKALVLGSWVVLAGHEIGEPNVQTTETAMLEELFAYLEEKNEIWLAPVGKVAEHVKLERQEMYQSMVDHLTFFSSFDNGSQADFAKGDANIYSAKSYDEADRGEDGIHNDGVELLKEKGIIGGALQFQHKTKEVLYYKAKDNLTHDQSDHEGTISLWLSLDPESDLEPGYCDPIQITDVGYNDAAYWVDFSDKNPRLFRMGVFGDLKVWNPKNIGPDANPDFTDRLVVARDRPFGHDVWTHVVICYNKINSRDGGKASFYVNGFFQGERHIPESFTWNIDKSKIFLGLNYVGLIDEVAIFNKALSPEEVQLVFQLEGGIGTIVSGN